MKEQLPEPKLWIEETKELDVYETEFSWNLKGLVAIAIAIAIDIAVRKKSLAAAEPAIQFSETPPCRERALDRCSRLETPPPHSVNKWLAFSMDEESERDKTWGRGGLPTLPGLYHSTIQPSRRGFFWVHTCVWRERKPEAEFLNF